MTSIYRSHPSLIHEHQKEYYNAINRSSTGDYCSIFIEFMLTMILDALRTVTTPQVAPEVTSEVEKLISVLTDEMSRKQLQAKLGLKDEKNFREKYLAPALSHGMVGMTLPQKPRSRLQKYRLTEKGILFKG